MDEIRRFTKEDWYGWAGATRFSNNTDPFIYTNVLDSSEGSVDMAVIADAEGLSIALIGEDEFLTWIKSVKLTPLKAEGEIRALVEVLEDYTNAADLCYALDNELKTEFKGFLEA